MLFISDDNYSTEIKKKVTSSSVFCLHTEMSFTIFTVFGKKNLYDVEDCWLSIFLLYEFTFINPSIAKLHENEKNWMES